MLKENASRAAKNDTGGEIAGKIKIRAEEDGKQQERGTGERMDITLTKSITSIKTLIKIREKDRRMNATVRARPKGPREAALNAEDPTTRKIAPD